MQIHEVSPAKKKLKPKLKPATTGKNAEQSNIAILMKPELAYHYS